MIRYWSGERWNPGESILGQDAQISYVGFYLRIFVERCRQKNEKKVFIIHLCAQRNIIAVYILMISCFHTFSECPDPYFGYKVNTDLAAG